MRAYNRYHTGHLRSFPNVKQQNQWVRYHWSNMSALNLLTPIIDRLDKTKKNEVLRAVLNEIGYAPEVVNELTTGVRQADTVVEGLASTSSVVEQLVQLNSAEPSRQSVASPAAEQESLSIVEAVKQPTSSKVSTKQQTSNKEVLKEKTSSKQPNKSTTSKKLKSKAKNPSKESSKTKTFLERASKTPVTSREQTVAAVNSLNMGEEVGSSPLPAKTPKNKSKPPVTRIQYNPLQIIRVQAQAPLTTLIRRIEVPVEKTVIKEVERVEYRDVEKVVYVDTHEKLYTEQLRVNSELQDRIESLNTRMVSDQEHSRDTIQQLNEGHSQHLQKQKNKKKRYKEKAAQLDREFHTYKTNYMVNETVQRDNKNLSQTVESLNRDNSRLRQETTNLHFQNESLKNDVMALREEQKKINSFQQPGNNPELARVITELNAAVETSRAHAQENSSLKQQLENLKTDYQALKELQGALLKEKGTFKEKAEALEEVNRELLSKNKEIQQLADSTLAELQKQRQHDEYRIRTLESFIKAGESNLESVKLQHEKDTKTAQLELEKSSASLKESIEALKKENETLRQGRKSDQAAIRRQEEQFKAENQKLLKLVNEHKASADAASALNKQVKLELNRANRALLKLSEDAAKQKLTLEQDKELLEAQNAQYQKDLELAQFNLNSSNTLVGKVQRQLEQLQEELQKVREGRSSDIDIFKKVHQDDLNKKDQFYTNKLLVLENQIKGLLSKEELSGVEVKRLEQLIKQQEQLLENASEAARQALLKNNQDAQIFAAREAELMKKISLLTGYQSEMQNKMMQDSEALKVVMASGEADKEKIRALETKLQEIDKLLILKNSESAKALNILNQQHLIESSQFKEDIATLQQTVEQLNAGALVLADKIAEKKAKAKKQKEEFLLHQQAADDLHNQTMKEQLEAVHKQKAKEFSILKEEGAVYREQNLKIKDELIELKQKLSTLQKTSKQKKLIVKPQVSKGKITMLSKEKEGLIMTLQDLQAKLASSQEQVKQLEGYKTKKERETGVGIHLPARPTEPMVTSYREPSSYELAQAALKDTIKDPEALKQALTLLNEINREEIKKLNESYAIEQWEKQAAKFDSLGISIDDLISMFQKRIQQKEQEYNENLAKLQDIEKRAQVNSKDSLLASDALKYYKQQAGNSLINLHNKLSEIQAASKTLSNMQSLSADHKAVLHAKSVAEIAHHNLTLPPDVTDEWGLKVFNEPFIAKYLDYSKDKLDAEKQARVRHSTLLNQPLGVISESSGPTVDDFQEVKPSKKRQRKKSTPISEAWNKKYPSKK